MFTLPVIVTLASFNDAIWKPVRLTGAVPGLCTSNHSPLASEMVVGSAMISEITSRVVLASDTAALGPDGTGTGADGVSDVPAHALSTAAAIVPVSSDRQRVRNRIEGMGVKGGGESRNARWRALPHTKNTACMGGVRDDRATERPIVPHRSVARLPIACCRRCATLPALAARH